MFLYRLIQKIMPGKPDDPKKWYAIGVSRGEITLRDLYREIALISTVSPVDTAAVVEAFLQLVPKYLCDGQIVRLGDFGSFSLRISSEGAETEGAFKSSMIKDAKIHFRPGKEVENVLNNLAFEKEA